MLLNSSESHLQGLSPGAGQLFNLHSHMHISQEEGIHTVVGGRAKGGRKCERGEKQKNKMEKETEKD